MPPAIECYLCKIGAMYVYQVYQDRIFLTADKKAARPFMSLADLQMVQEKIPSVVTVHQVWVGKSLESEEEVG